MRATCTPRPNTYLVNTETLVTAGDSGNSWPRLRVPWTSQQKKLQKEQEKREKQEELTRLKTKIADLSADKVTLQGKIDDLSADKVTLQGKTVALRRELDYQISICKRDSRLNQKEIVELRTRMLEHPARELHESELRDVREQYQKQLEQYQKEFANVSTDLYFTLMQLDLYVHDEAPYNLHAENKESLIVLTQHFLMDRLTSACDRTREIADYLLPIAPDFTDMTIVQHELDKVAERHFGNKLAVTRAKAKALRRATAKKKTDGTATNP